MHKRTISASTRRVLAVGLSLLVASMGMVVRPLAGSAIAPTTDTWTGATSGLWSVSTNWSPAVVPVTGDNLVFPVGTANTAMTDDIGGAAVQTSFTDITFQGTGYILGRAGTRSIGISGNLTDDATTLTNTINVPITYTSDPTVITAGGDPAHTLIFSPSAVATKTGGSITFVGPGVIQMSTNNAFTAPVTIDGPSHSEVYDSNVAAAFGSGAITVEDGGQLAIGGPSTFGNSITLNGAGPVVNGVGTGAFETHAGDQINLTGGLTIAANSTVSVLAGSVLQISGAITGTGDLGITGNGGQVELVGAPDNSGFTGAVTVDNAELDLNNTRTPALGSTSVTVGTLAGANTAKLVFQHADQFPTNATDLAVNPVGTATATVDMTASTDETVNNLYLTGAAITNTAASHLTVAGDITANESATTSRIGSFPLSSLAFTAGAHTITAVPGSVPVSLDINSQLTAAGAITKSGDGVLDLHGTVAAPLGIAATAGSVENLSVSASTPFSANGATLEGSGTNGATSVTGSGSLMAIDSAGNPTTLTVGSLSLAATSSFGAVINGATPGTQYGQVDTAGTIGLGSSNLFVEPAAGFTPAVGSQFTIINNTGTNPVVSTFAGHPEGSTFLVNRSVMQVSYVGGTGHSVVLTAVASPASGLFVRQLYDDLLGRPADDGGLAYWVGQLNSGARSRGQVIQAFVDGVEHRTLYVNTLFARYLQRDADPSGLAWSVQQLGAGMSEEQLVETLVSSPEYLSLAGNSTTTRIENLYRDILNRSPSPGATDPGVLYWLSSGMTIGQIAAAFVNSTEGRVAFISEAYFTFLDRAPDPGGFQSYLSRMAAGESRASVNLDLMSSDEYYFVPNEPSQSG